VQQPLPAVYQKTKTQSLVLIWKEREVALQFEPFKFETVQVNDKGEVVQRQELQMPVFRQSLGSGIDLELVSLPGGFCQIGSPLRQGYEDEHPQHPVMIPPFLLGKFLITQEQWKVVMGKDLPYRRIGARNPADRASWKDASAFCQKLAKMTRLPFRLPSEAEWEYACRAGTSSPFYYGPTLTTDLANYVGDHIFASEPPGVYRHGTSQVGSFPPNAYGLFDMHGNLWEWCADDWLDDYAGAAVDGQPRKTHNQAFSQSSGVSAGKVVRGGSWHETPNHCRSAVRLKFKANERDDYVGFRVALTQLKDN
jgi:formylglycine-generating enzyme required for sulfatase activity